jgi:D-sedoheptulose 7-phosphate isomerase
MEQRIVELFHQSIEAKMNSYESLAPSLVQASELCVASLLEGNKILCCGNGISASLTSIFCQNMIHQYQLERPGFPVIALHSDSALVTGIATINNFNEVFSRQVRTLGNPQDILVTFSTGEDPANLSQAIHTAHDRDMSIISFCAGDDDNLRSLLRECDADIYLPLTNIHRIQEIQLLSLFAVCDLIDQQLFGGSD